MDIFHFFFQKIQSFFLTHVLYFYREITTDLEDALKMKSFH